MCPVPKEAGWPILLRGLVENVERGKKVKGGSSVANRVCELLGKHLGMFSDHPPKKLTFEDLTEEDIHQLLRDAMESEPDVFQ